MKKVKKIIYVTGLFNILINSKNCVENSRQLGHFLVKRDKNLAKVLNKLPINHVCFKKYDFILELLEQDFIENLSLVDKFINNLGKFLLPEIENILINPKTTPNWFKKHNLILSKIIQMTKGKIKLYLPYVSNVFYSYLCFR